MLNKKSFIIKLLDDVFVPPSVNLNDDGFYRGIALNEHSWENPISKRHACWIQAIIMIVVSSTRLRTFHSFSHPDYSIGRTPPGRVSSGVGLDLRLEETVDDSDV